MKKSLTVKESIIVGSMLFGMFFGAGNLIFPIHMGQLAGSNVFPAILGFICTGVGIPLLGVACLGASKKESLFDLASLVGDRYKFFFTIILYLTIGPLFAIPRCATTSFTIGMEPLLEVQNKTLYHLIFTFIFFTIVLLFSLNPNRIVTLIGKYINPAFLILLGTLIVTSFIKPLGNINSVLPDPTYTNDAFFKGFIEGYNTMDAIAALAFGITVIDVIKSLGIKDESDIAINTLRAGIIGGTLMAVIYILTTVMGTLSRNEFSISSNGGIALSEIANYYFGNLGIYFMLITVTLACLKTAIALVVSCSEIFKTMFPNFLSIKKWVIIFTIFSFAISNFGLDSIIKYTIPVLMFLYPLTISIILLSLFGKLFNFDKCVFAYSTLFTAITAIFDFFVALPEGLISENISDAISTFCNKYLPFFNIGLGWVVPMSIGFFIGIIVRAAKRMKNS